MSRDDTPLFKMVKDISGGVNNRHHGSIISDNQVTVLENADLSVLGESKKRAGLTLVEDLGTDAGTATYGFMPVGKTTRLIATHGQKLEQWSGSSTFTEIKTDFTAGTLTKLLKVGKSGEGDVLLAFVTGNNWFEFTDTVLGGTGSPSDLGNTASSPPASQAALWFRQRLWILKDNLLYWSSSFPADFSSAFATSTDAFQVDVGAERALISIREQGIVVMGSDYIYGVNPGTETDSTPSATDRVEKLLDIGCVAGKTAVQVGDDVLFLATDGVRGLFRSQQDKLQTGSSYPLSYNLKEQFEDINWAHISKATAVFFDNKYFIALPSGASTDNDTVWVYYPATQAWSVITGWNVADWAKIILSGEERLYFIDSSDGSVYRAWHGDTDAQGTFTVSCTPDANPAVDESIITSTSGNFEAKDVGKWINFEDGSSYLIYSFTDASNVVIQGRVTKSSQQAYVGIIYYKEEGRKEDFGKPLVTKCGGEVRIKALSSGDYDLDIYIEIDDGGYVFLGSMNLDGGAPTLPRSLPFTLGAVSIKEQIFHLDRFGPFKQIRLKIEHNDTNGSDDIKIYERTIVTYADEYQPEYTIS